MLNLRCALNSSLPQLSLAIDEETSRSGLFRLNLVTHKIDQRAELPVSEHGQVLGDLVIADDDTIYTTDSLTGVLYRYSIADKEFVVEVESGKFISPQGLVLDSSDDFYFIANSHCSRFDRNNNLPDGLSNPIVLKAPLQPAP